MLLDKACSVVHSNSAAEGCQVLVANSFLLHLMSFAGEYKAVVYSSLHAVLSSRFCCTDDSHPSAGPHLSSR